MDYCTKSINRCIFLLADFRRLTDCKGLKSFSIYLFIIFWVPFVVVNCQFSHFYVVYLETKKKFLSFWLFSIQRLTHDFSFFLYWSKREEKIDFSVKFEQQPQATAIIKQRAVMAKLKCEIWNHNWDYYFLLIRL